MDRLFGRDAELEALTRLCAEERLVTVVGPGGVGKTRLAREHLARADGGRAPVVCELAGLPDRAALLRALAVALDARSSGDGASPSAIAAALRERGPTRLVLDNCEHLIDAAAELCALLLAEAPQVALLATSRERLRVRGERVLALAPLTVPAAAEDPTDAAGYALLVDRIRAQDGAFAPDPAQRALLAAVARAVDGLPLALELVAPKIVALGVENVAARIEDQLDLLDDGPRDATAHHRALRASIAWSWDLLDAEDRRALAALSVFRGGFTLASAAALLGGEAGAARALPRLRERSLVTVEDRPGSGRRFGLLEAVREFAAEQLGLSDDARYDAERAHARHFAAALQDLGREQDERPSASVEARLLAEHGNLGALAQALSRDGLDAEGAEILLGALSAVPAVSMPFSFPRLAELLEAALAALPPTDAMGARGRYALGSVRWRTGPLEQAAEAFAEAARLAGAQGDARLEGRAQAMQAMVLAQQASDERSRGLLVSALALHRATGDRRFESSTLLRLGFHFAETGRAPREAQTHFEQALAAARLLGDPRLEAQALSAIGVVLAELGDVATALERLALAQRKSPTAQPAIDCALGMVQHVAGHLAEAAQTLATAAACASGRRDRYAEALCRGFGGLVGLERGDPDAPAALLGATTSFEAIGLARYAAFFRAHALRAEAAPSAASAVAERIDALAAGLASEADPLRPALRLLAASARELAARPEAPASDRLQAAEASALSGVPHRVVELLLTVRVLRREGRPADGDLARARGPALRVAADGSWFERDAGRVSLASKPTLARLLARLARGWAEQRGELLSADALVAATWPGEKMSFASAKTRLKVAIVKLRDAGLRDVLRSGPGSYGLTPDCEISRGPGGS